MSSHDEQFAHHCHYNHPFFHPAINQAVIVGSKAHELRNEPVRRISGRK